MTINVNTIGQFGTPLQTSFSDSLATGLSNNLNGVTNNINWIFMILNWQTAFASPVGFPSFKFGSTLSAGGGFGLASLVNQIGANPTYFVAGGVVPRPIMNLKYYNAQIKFVQVTFNAQSGFNQFLGFFNYEDVSGTGIGHANGEIAHDGYFMGSDGSLNRNNSVAHQATLNAGTGAIVQGDVCRLSMDVSNPAQVTLIFTKNGVIQFTQVDNNVDRINNGVNGNAWPAIIQANGVAASAGEWKNFSTGLGL